MQKKLEKADIYHTISALQIYCDFFHTYHLARMPTEALTGAFTLASPP